MLTATALAGCSTERVDSEQAVDPVGATPTATPDESTPPMTRGEQWACSPDQVYGFAADPVVYPPELSLAEVLSELSQGRVEEGIAEETPEVDSDTGRLASVTFRNEEGLILRRLEFERSESVGWHVERGRAC